MSLVAMNSLYKNHMLAKQNRSSRQARCVATSNWHVHFLPPFFTCYKSFVAGKVGSVATHKVKTFTDHTVQGYVHVQCQWLTFIKNSTTHLFILVRNNKLFISCFGFLGCENFYDTAPVNLFKTLETFSIRFFMGNCKPQTQNVTWPQPCAHVCSLQFMFELPAVSDLQQGFLPQKIVQPCV